MRIVLVEPYGTRMGHFGLWAAQIGQQLSMLGHEVVVVTGTRLETQQFLRTEPRFRLVEVGFEDAYFSPSASRLPKLFRRIMQGPTAIRINLIALSRALRVSAGEAFDIVHLLALEPLSSALLLLWNEWIRNTRPAPLVLQIFPVDFSLLRHRGNIFRGLYKLAAALALRFIIHRYSKAVSVQGEWHRTRLMKQLGCSGPSAPPFVVVRPGTILPEGEVSTSDARRAWGLDPDATVFLFFGMLRKDKGIDVLLNAVSELRGNWQLLIAGAPLDWTAEKLRASIARSGHPRRVLADVRYIPEDEIATYFVAADAVVLPYLGENYIGNYGPMMLACGYARPLIVSDVGEMGWLVRAHGLGYAVRPDHAGALREALDAFVRLPEEARHALGFNARKLAERCSFASMARLLCDIYAGRPQAAAFPQAHE